ncbi:MAG: hypothetical protein GEU89_21315 [Kiloniellaceae bacterium]|nr:hypothetical protein [Kiloniellaceae bacterium]
MRPEVFLSVNALTTIVSSQAPLLIATLGLTVTLIVKEFDLSIGANLVFVDVLVASADELPIVTDDTSDPAGALLASGIGEVVVTRGAAGAETVTADGRTTCAAAQVTAIDPVGAGDAFVTGYLSARLDGLGVPARLERGTAVAGFVVSTHGDWEGLPTRAELALAGHVDGTVR